ncbi:MAG: hypothetical protein JWO82_4067 [Akkermansiaceae bacterium]|nr:hypothetical protein [Akkermansiaceae bacterium]
MSDLNPYAAPVDLSAPPPLVSTARFYREGKFLRILTETELPLICPISGEPTTAEDWRKKKSIAWTPQWILIGIVIATLPVLILAIALQKRGKITYSLSAAAAKRIKTRYIIGTALLVLAIGLLLATVGMPSDRTPIFALLTVLTFVAALIFFVIANPFKPAGYNKGWFKLRGCSPQFLDTLPDFPYATAKDIPNLQR